MKLFGIEFGKKNKPLTEEDFVKAAEACNFNNAKFIGTNAYRALLNFVGTPENITKKFLKSIPDEDIEQIKGIKSAGHTIITYLKVN